MKISTKLILLIVSALVIFGVSFGVNYYFDQTSREFTLFAEKLQGVQIDLLQTVVDEKQFMRTHDGAMASTVIAEANTALEKVRSAIETAPILSEEMKSIPDQLKGYVEAFESVSRNIQQITSLKNDVSFRLEGLIDQGNDLTGEMDGLIAMAFIEEGEADPSYNTVVVSLKAVSAWITRLDLVLNRDLLLESREEVFTETFAKVVEEVAKENKNLQSLGQSIKDAPVSAFAQALEKVMAAASEQIHEIHNLWKQNNDYVSGLDALRESILNGSRDAAKSAEEATDRMWKQGVTAGIAAIIIAVAVLLLEGFLISRSVGRSIQDTIGFARNLSKGDVSVRLPMGRPMNCTEMESCKEEGCPCHGEPSHCWVTAGSYSSDPKCPKIIKGEDCRSCGVYRNARLTEIETMGSALNAMADELARKADAAAGIADGDLNQTIHVASEKDVLGLSLRRMVESLNTVLADVNAAAARVNSGAEQVSDSSHSLSQGASEQAASLEEITSSLTELGSQTRNNSETAGQVSVMAVNARDKAVDGNEMMHDLVSAMDGINDSSREIAKIIKAIDDIAFQTNLLALNAAVEAARAGRHGKGFAVVAQEVRNLAGRSAKAAKETSDLIEGSVNRIDDGSRMVRKTAEAFEVIVQDVTKVTDLVSEIASASNEQAEGITQINQGLSQIEKVTQQNTANSEQTASAAQELTHQANTLHSILSNFRLAESGRGTHPGQGTEKAIAGNDADDLLDWDGDDAFGESGQDLLPDSGAPFMLEADLSGDEKTDRRKSMRRNG